MIDIDTGGELYLVAIKRHGFGAIFSGEFVYPSIGPSDEILCCIDINDGEPAGIEYMDLYPFLDVSFFSNPRCPVANKIGAAKLEILHVAFHPYLWHSSVVYCWAATPGDRNRNS